MVLCAVREDGAALCWGMNSYGQLGDLTFIAAKVPVPVAGASDWVAVAAGEFSTCGVRTNGTMWCWGDNGSGLVGPPATWRDRPEGVGVP